MSLFNGITDRFGRYMLGKDLRNEHKVVVQNLGGATKIGIVYRVKDERSFKRIKNYVKKLKEEQGISKILALGYYDGGDQPAYLDSRLHYDYFNNKELNWYGRPHGNKIENFTGEDYDILIDLSLEDSLPIQFIMAKSKARFKVGRLSPLNEKINDMLIDMAGVQSLSQYILQVDHYLTIINSKNNNGELESPSARAGAGSGDGHPVQ